MALTISSVVNKKKQRVAIMFIKIFEIISESPCSFEQIFAKIVKLSGQNILKSTDLDSHSFCCFKAATA